MKKILIQLWEFIYEKRRILNLRVNYRLHIMNPDRTIRYIIEKKCSVARFGDGEFNHIMMTQDEGFQLRSEALSKELKNVLTSSNPHLLLCVPSCMNSVKGCKKESVEFWIDWGKNGHHETIIEMIRSLAGKDYLFGDTQITRPYIDWKDTKRADRLFPKLKQIWCNRDILIVEGDQTRLGVGNDLFGGAKTIKRIIAPAIGAFEVRKEIESAIQENYHGELVLLALGPTATILASNLANAGIQAIDIGNIDIEYEWYLRNAEKKVPIPGKYTYETKEEYTFVECVDEEYLKQIIDRILV